MPESIVFCSACTMSSVRKFTFAMPSPDEFLVYVGSDVDANGTCGRRTVVNGLHVCTCKRSVFKRHDARISLKLCLLDSVLSVLNYGAESWTLITELKRRCMRVRPDG